MKRSLWKVIWTFGEDEGFIFHDYPNARGKLFMPQGENKLSVEANPGAASRGKTHIPDNVIEVIVELGLPIRDVTEEIIAVMTKGICPRGV